MTKPIALVTGGSRGIGRAIVEELSSTHSVIATYNSNLGAAQDLAQATGATILPCQLGDPSSCREFLAELDLRFPQSINLLVNNAGMAPRERLQLERQGPAYVTTARDHWGTRFAGLRVCPVLTAHHAYTLDAEGERHELIR